MPELRLTGKDKENYILVQPTDEIPLTKAVNVAKSSGLQIEEQNKSYLYLKDQEERISLREILPVDCGNAQYAAPEMTGNMEYITEPSIADDILSYTVKQGALDRKGKIQIKVTTENYEDFVITFNLECNDQTPVRLQEGTEVTLKKIRLLTVVFCRHWSFRKQNLWTKKEIQWKERLYGKTAHKDRIHP